MEILGNRVLVSQIEKENKEDGFQTIEVQDDFLYRAKVEQLGNELNYNTTSIRPINIGDVVLFAKYSPHTQSIKIENRDMKIVRFDDILAIE